MAYSVMNAAIISRPECIASDNMPRLLVENPIVSLNRARPAEIAMEDLATLRRLSLSLCNSY
jgi:hypothetical protein